jgi:hypothetical protein
MRKICVGLLVLSACASDDLLTAETTFDLQKPPSASYHLPTTQTVFDLQNPPSDAVFVPADYDGDGRTDLAVKGSNGVWYIDVAACSGPVITGSPELVDEAPETDCSNFVDDDLDGLINDGCPAVGAPETGCDGPYNTAFDDDNDGYIDDGCPTNPQCLGDNGFGGRWDFAYPGYGDANAVPIPADYGTLYGGPADGRADLSIRDASGMWAIDYADNGFGTWDEIRTNYGDGTTTTAYPADYDGDGRADLAVRTNDGLGAWFFDYSSDGFNGWNAPCSMCPCMAQSGGYPIYKYGSLLDTPAVGDFDGDSCADISVKNQNGAWYFDLAKNGFFGWESPCPRCPVPITGYGDYTSKPIVANYDPGYDNRADLAVMTSSGYWAIDFAADGFGTWNTWPMYYAGWGGGAGSVRVGPGHYTSATTSANLDQAVLDPYGNWYIDRAYNGYGSLDLTLSTNRILADTSRAQIDSMYISTPVPPATCGNGACTPGEGCSNCPADCGTCVPAGNFSETAIDPATLKIGVRYTANVHVIPNTWCDDGADNDSDGRPNDGCPAFGAPETDVACTDFTDNDGDLHLNDGCPIDGLSEAEEASLRVNPDLDVPPHLNVQNVGGHVVQNSVLPIVYPHYRRFAFTCTQPGSYPLGFMLSYAHQSSPLNVDYGQRVICTADHPGLYGRVTDKKTRNSLASATVTINGNSILTDANGFWHFAGLTGGPYTIQISKSGYAPAEVVNVRVAPFGSPAGTQVDTPLEAAFVLQNGITYKTYFDYSRGRSIFHVVRIDVTSAPITLGRVPLEANGSDFQRLLDVATAQGAPVMVNGIWWTGIGKNNVTVIGENRCELQQGPATLAGTRAIGYLYINGFVSAIDATQNACANGVCRPGDLECGLAEWFADPVPGRPAAPPVLIQNAWQAPMFTVRGTGTQQRATIIMTDTDFVTSTNGWKRIASVPNCPAGNVCPIYDAVSPFNVSDYSYAFQMGHFLLKSGQLMSRGIAAKLGTAFPGEHSFARTTIGTSSTETVAWIVVADGEGIDGGLGATEHQLAEFYKNVLGANNAMVIDSGESTELVVRGSTGPRRVNRLASENHAADGLAPNGDYTPSGRVFAYIKIGM